MLFIQQPPKFFILLLVCNNNILSTLLDHISTIYHSQSMNLVFGNNLALAFYFQTLFCFVLVMKNINRFFLEKKKTWHQLCVMMLQGKITGPFDNRYGNNVFRPIIDLGIVRAPMFCLFLQHIRLLEKNKNIFY